MKDVAVILISVLFAALRLAGLKDPIFQAFAHIWIGVLPTIWYFTRRGFYIDWFVGLCVVEVIQASIDHFLK